jgi:cysteine desulfurase family protein
MIYFDNASTSFPKPRRVREGVLSAFNCYGANPGRSGHKMALDTAMQVYSCREDIAALFGAEAEQVIFTANCSHALNTAIKGILRQGDHAVVSEFDHNSVLRPVHALADRGIITYSVAGVSEDDDATLASFAACIRPETRLITCTHASNVNGMILPIAKLAALARAQGILFLVDAAQTAGALPINMQKLGIDFLCAAGHKSLYGPTGTGVLVTPHGHELATLMEGGSGSNSADPFMPKDAPERLECGTLNTAGILGLKAGVAFLNEFAPGELYRREMRLGAEIYARLAKMPGVTLHTRGFRPGRHVPVIAFNVDGLPSEETVARLSDRGFALRGGLHCAPLAHRSMGTLETGAARISIGAFNPREQGEGLCGAIQRIAISVSPAFSGRNTRKQRGASTI